MKAQIDIKSALLGIVVGMLTIFAIGAGTSSNAVDKYRVAGASAPNGSFFVIIDTQTGQAWGSDSVGNFKDDRSFWEPK